MVRARMECVLYLIKKGLVGMVQLRYFHCPVCKTKMMAPKSRNFKRENFKGRRHRKIMYCAICQEKRNFILDEITKLR